MTGEEPSGLLDGARQQVDLGIAFLPVTVAADEVAFQYFKNLVEVRGIGTIVPGFVFQTQWLPALDRDEHYLEKMFWDEERATRSRRRRCYLTW
jgi:hypothetical protein